jgi:pimeloyl-ACP methyl ester carboxylesterase
MQQVTMINRVVGSDFVYWLAIHTMRTAVIDLLGVSRKVQARATPEEQALMDKFLETMLPMHIRLDGITLDQSRYLPRHFPLGEIAAPALVIHARDDKLVAFEHGQHSAQKIPNATLLSFDDGGHFLAGHYAEVREASAAFLEEHVVGAKEVV